MTTHRECAKTAMTMREAQGSGGHLEASLEVSVVVLSWNTRDLLRECLQSVYETAGDARVQVVVVDNASSDDSVAMVRREFPEALLIENPENVGFAKGNNQAFEVCTGRYMLLLNSDAVLRPGTLQAMGTFMENHSEAGILGAKLLNPDGSFQASYFDFPTIGSEILLITKLSKVICPPWYPSHSAEDGLQFVEADWVHGACLMVRRETVSRIGGLDEDFFMYAEEVDWCWRAKKAGWKVCYLPGAQTVHWGGQSMGLVSLEKRSRVYKGKLFLFRKHRGARYAACYRLVLWLLTGLKVAVWTPALLAPREQTRSRARQNVRSYCLLMREM